MRRSQPDGVRWEIQARLAARYAIDTNSVCYRSSGAQAGESASGTTPAFFMNKFRKLGFIHYNGGLKVHNSLARVLEE